MNLTTSSLARICSVAAALCLAGCSSSSSGADASSTDQSAAFTGAWTFGSGSITPMCNLSIPAVDLTGDTMTVTRVDDTHVKTSLTGSGVSCEVNFVVSGGTATAQTGQSCTVTETITLGTPMSIAVTIDISSWAMTVSGSALTMTMSGTASAAGGVLSCTPTADGTATRTADAGTT